MNQHLFEFYLNRKGYDMAIIIPGKVIEPRPQPAPQPAPNNG